MNIRDNYIHYLRTGRWISIFRPYAELMAEHLASQQQRATDHSTHFGSS
jgi:hypothetical protein